MARDTDGSSVRRYAMFLMLWGGILLCVLAMGRHWEESSELLSGIGMRGGLAVAVGFSVMWLLAVASWREVIAAYSDQSISWRTASRHLALLLLGKYLPGGVWGFAMRLGDSISHGAVAPMATAGIAEQWIGLATMSLLGAIAFAMAYFDAYALAALVVLVPAVVLLGWKLTGAFAVRLAEALFARMGRPSIGIVIVHGRLRRAVFLTMFQLIVTLGIVAGIAMMAFQLDLRTTLALAGAYGLSVVAGMIIVFVPGGIVVREGVFLLLCKDWLDPAQAIALAASLRLIFTVLDLGAGAAAAGLHLTRRAT